MRKALLACTAIFVATPAWAADEASAQKSDSSQSGAVVATGAASSAAAQPSPAPGSAEERDMLLQEIRGLRDRVTALEARSSQVQYSPEMPPELIKDLFESRTTPELGWPQGKPLPDLNQFVDRSIVNEVLKEMGRKPGGK